MAQAHTSLIRSDRLSVQRGRCSFGIWSFATYLCPRWERGRLARHRVACGHELRTGRPRPQHGFGIPKPYYQTPARTAIQPRFRIKPRLAGLTYSRLSGLSETHCSCWSFVSASQQD